MKRYLILALLALGILAAAPAWSHHAAEGIVSDDIWQMIDGLLEDADSPHLNIDFDDVMDSMGVASVGGFGDSCSGNNDCGGRLLLVTSVTVPTEYVDEYMIYIDFAVSDRNRVPSGKTSSGTALKLKIVIDDLDDGWTEISLLEPIGNGQPLDNLVP